MAERQQRLSYKFQRLRERLREAIETGVLSGKLPGERVLARQFRVNAKTLSKALTDLAAEGLLERTIGRGTFVRGQGAEGEDDAPKSLGRWLLLCKPGAECSSLSVALQQVNSDSETLSDLQTLRPSYLNGFTAVVDLHGGLPELTLRDLILRSLRVILVDSLPKTYSTHAVLIDRHFSASMLTRDLIASGYRTFHVVEPGGEREVFEAVRATARRLHAGDVRVEPSSSEDALRDVAGRGSRDTAYLCASMETASDVLAAARKSGANVPSDVGVVGVGLEGGGEGFRPCSGYVVRAEQVADSIRQLITEVQVHRPTPLWLVGTSVDEGTARRVDGTPPATHANDGATTKSTSTKAMQGAMA